MFRWGILGNAKIAREHLIPAIQSSPNGIVKALASQSPQHARTLGDSLKIAHIDSYESLLARDDIDGVYIPLPNHLHVPWTIKALQANKHVLCEKPWAMRLDELDALARVRESSNLLAAEAFMVLHHPQWHKVRQLIDDKEIGDLVHVQSSFAFPLHDNTNIRNDPKMGGGALYDIGVYPLSTTRFATRQDPLSVRATMVIEAATNVDIRVNCDLTFADFTMQFHCGIRQSLFQQSLFQGTKGTIQMRAPFNADVYGPVEVVLKTAHFEQHWHFPHVNQYALQVTNFAEAAMHNTPYQPDWQFSYQNMRCLEAIFASHQNGGAPLAVPQA